MSAGPVVPYSSFKRFLCEGIIKFLEHDIRVILLHSSYVPSLDHTAYTVAPPEGYSSVIPQWQTTYPAVGAYDVYNFGPIAGYPQYGKELTGKRVENVDGTLHFYADPVTWLGLTATFKYAVLIDKSVNYLGTPEWGYVSTFIDGVPWTQYTQIWRDVHYAPTLGYVELGVDPISLTLTDYTLGWGSDGLFTFSS